MNVEVHTIRDGSEKTVFAAQSIHSLGFEQVEVRGFFVVILDTRVKALEE